MSDLSPETNQLLELARSAGSLTDERRTQLKTGLLTQIAAIGLVGATSAGAGATVVAGAAAGTGASAAGAGATAGKASLAWLSSSLFKAISALTLISATGAGVYAVSHARLPAEPTHAAPSSASTAQVVATPSTPSTPSTPPTAAIPFASPEVAPADAVHDKRAAPPRASTVAPSSAPALVSAETLAEETRLLRDADQALRAGNAQRALTLLDEHASRYPRGALTPERNAERLIARCKLGQVNAKSAQAYLSTHANSAFAPRIRAACGVTTP